MDVDRIGYSAQDTYSHSIVNERSKLLIGKALNAASKILAVILTVNLPGAAIGAGFRAVRPKLTFRHLSTPTTIADAIDARACHSGKRPRTAGIRRLELLSQRTRRQFYRQRPAGAVPSLSASDGLSASNPLRAIIDTGCAR